MIRIVVCQKPTFKYDTVMEVSSARISISEILDIMHKSFLEDNDSFPTDPLII